MAVSRVPWPTNGLRDNQKFDCVGLHDRKPRRWVMLLLTVKQMGLWRFVCGPFKVRRYSTSPPMQMPAMNKKEKALHRPFGMRHFYSAVYLGRGPMREFYTALVVHVWGFCFAVQVLTSVVTLHGVWTPCSFVPLAVVRCLRATSRLLSFLLFLSYLFVR